MPDQDDESLRLDHPYLTRTPSNSHDQPHEEFDSAVHHTDKLIHHCVVAEPETINNPADHFDLVWRPTEAWIDRSSKIRLPLLGSMGLRRFRCEKPTFSREYRMEAFLAGQPIDNANRFYLENFCEGYHIQSRDISMPPYLPRGQAKHKSSSNWLERMESLGHLAQHSKYFFPAPSKLSQEIFRGNDGELQTRESREYLAAMREPIMFPKGSHCIGDAADCYVYSAGPYYTFQDVSVQGASMTTAVPRPIPETSVFVDQYHTEHVIMEQGALEDSPLYSTLDLSTRVIERVTMYSSKILTTAKTTIISRRHLSVLGDLRLTRHATTMRTPIAPL